MAIAAIIYYISAAGALFSGWIVAGGDVEGSEGWPSLFWYLLSIWWFGSGLATSSVAVRLHRKRKSVSSDERPPRAIAAFFTALFSLTAATVASMAATIFLVRAQESWWLGFIGVACLAIAAGATGLMASLPRSLRSDS